jgi:uncharacterized protein (UPF0332 family)
VIAIFDRDLVHTGKIEKHYSKIVHKMFAARQQVDYKELVETPVEDAEECVRLAKEFLHYVQLFMGKNRI